MTDRELHDRFETWLLDHAAILHHVVNGFAEGEDRNDLMQELLLALWKAAPSFRGDAKPSTYIYRVSHNAALTWKRTQSNYRRKLDKFEVHTEIHSRGTQEERNESVLLERLYAAIRELPPVDRSLALLMLDGLSYSDMAQVHGLSESNVGVRIHRLKQKRTETMKGKIHEL